MVRSYEFNKYFIEKLIKAIDSNFVFKDFDFELNKKAYDRYFENYYTKNE